MSKNISAPKGVKAPVKTKQAQTGKNYPAKKK